MNIFKIQNFRLFNSKGTKVDFRPVTILTGANSSGKSSFVKSMILLKNYIDDVRKKQELNPAAVQLDLTDRTLKLSGFKDVLNFTCSENDPIVFSISCTSDYSPYEYEVKYSFVASPYSTTKGELDSIELFCDSELICRVDSHNGEMVATFPDLKGSLLNAFISYVKGVTYQHTPDCDELSSGVWTMKNVIKEWNEYSLDKYRMTELRGLGDGISEDFKDFSEHIVSLEKSGLMFAFPDIIMTGGAGKEFSMQTLKEATPDPILNTFVDRSGVDLKEWVVSEFERSKHRTFRDFYTEKENAALKGLSIKLRDIYKVDQVLRPFLFNSNWDVHNTDVVSCDNPKFNLTYFLRLSQFAYNWQSRLSERLVKTKKEASNDMMPDNGASLWSFHRLAALYMHYLNALLPDLLVPRDLGNMSFVGDSFTPIQRLYTYDDRSGFVGTMRRFQEYSRLLAQRKSAESNLDEKYNYNPGTFTSKWLKELNIGDSIFIEDDMDGLGFKVFLGKGGKKMSLADQGHGITQLVSILLQIECEIMKDKTNGQIAQSILAIEEPEVSLHPSMQSKLAMLFLDAANNGIHIIVETHSEYLIRRTQTAVASMKKNGVENPFSVYYFNSDGSSYELEYADDGRFRNSFGPGFFDEADNMAMELLSMKIAKP